MAKGGYALLSKAREHFAGAGQPRAAPVTFKQAQAKDIFQILYGLGDGWLGQRQPFSGLFEPPGAGDGDKGRQVPERRYFPTWQLNRMNFHFTDRI